MILHLKYHKKGMAGQMTRHYVCAMASSKDKPAVCILQVLMNQAGSKLAYGKKKKCCKKYKHGKPCKSCPKRG